jgi:hypothetical protein
MTTIASPYVELEETESSHGCREQGTVVSRKTMRAYKRVLI